MSLVTRCPQCATTFRVLPTQLSARGGRVRCGQCSAVFDGVSHLVTDEAAAAVPEEPERLSESTGAALPFEAREPTEAGEPSEAIETRTPTTEPDPQPAKIEAPLYEPPKQVENVRPPVDSIAPVASPELTASRKITVPAFLSPARPRMALNFIWAVLAIIALTALALQSTLHFRTEIAVLFPATRPFLEGTCELLGCAVRLPRRVDLMSIESSDLQADSQRPGVIVLNALLRNRAPFAQEYPDLELTLTDHGDQPVIRRVLAPADYLQEKRTARTIGLAGGAEETVRIFLDTTGVQATGYQLFLFYSCPPPASSAFWQLSYPSRCQDPRNK